MKYYLTFTDESGDFIHQMNEGQLRNTPFYVRASITIKADEWNRLKVGMDSLKARFGIPLDVEFKWNYLYSLRQYEMEGILDKNKLKVPYLSQIDFEGGFDYVSSCMSILHDLEHKTIVITYTDNELNKRCTRDSIMEWHLQNHMQRVEYEMKNADGTSQFCLDGWGPSDNQGLNKAFKTIYNRLYRNGDRYLDRYNRLFDELTLSDSKNSVGIQIADFIAGAASAYMKHKKQNKICFNYAAPIFESYIHPNLRTRNNSIMGSGFVDVPTNLAERSKDEELYLTRNSFAASLLSENRKSLYTSPHY